LALFRTQKEIDEAEDKGFEQGKPIKEKTTDKKDKKASSHRRGSAIKSTVKKAKEFDSRKELFVRKTNQNTELGRYDKNIADCYKERNTE
jgi:hypothetical protein